MKVTFTKTHEHGYSISVDGPDILSPLTMKRGAGYHPRLPHDVAHFIVENELGITGGVFGQIAAGGTGATFTATDPKKYKKVTKRGRKLAKAHKAEAMSAEDAIWAALSYWEKHARVPDTKIPEADLARIADQFENFARRWSRLPVSGSITLEWKPKALCPKTLK
jgi:hypothetical protein